MGTSCNMNGTNYAVIYILQLAYYVLYDDSGGVFHVTSKDNLATVLLHGGIDREAMDPSLQGIYTVWVHSTFLVLVFYTPHPCFLLVVSSFGLSLSQPIVVLSTLSIVSGSQKLYPSIKSQTIKLIVSGCKQALINLTID